VVDAIVDALRQERIRLQNSRPSSSSDPDSPHAQPLHAMSLPHLTPSSVVQDMMGRPNTSSSQSSFFAPQPIPSTAAGGEHSRSVSFLEPFADGNNPPSFASSPGSLATSAPKAVSSSSSQTTPTAMPDHNKAPAKVQKGHDNMDVDSAESEESRRKSMFDDLFSKHRGGSSVTSGDSESGGRRRPSLATTSGRGSAESSERLSTRHLAIGA